MDGKTVRGSRRTHEDKNVVHMVSALCCENGLVCGQLRTHAKTNELGTLPELLSILSLEGTLVSMDAMGCQVEIAEQILNSGGDYLFGLKGNQPNLYEEVCAAFEEARNPRRRTMEETAPPTLASQEENVLRNFRGNRHSLRRRRRLCNYRRDYLLQILSAAVYPTT